MLRILLADDHAVVRRGVKQILVEAFPQAVFGEAQNAHEVLELIVSERWDIVVLDLNMPGGNGLEALKQIKQDHPQLPVLILTMFPEDQYAVRTIRAGAAGYLTKRVHRKNWCRQSTKSYAAENISARRSPMSWCCMPRMRMINRCTNTFRIESIKFCVRLPPARKSKKFPSN